MHSRTRELLDYLDAQRAALREAFEAVPAESRDLPPAPGRWSAANNVEHLAIIEHRLAGIIMKKMAAAREEGVGPDESTDPILPTLDLGRVLNRSSRVLAPSAAQPTGLSADAAWEALERGGWAVRDALRACDGLDLGVIMHAHPLLGPMSLYHWFGFIAAHEARHAAQIREITLTV